MSRLVLCILALSVLSAIGEPHPGFTINGHAILAKPNKPQSGQDDPSAFKAQISDQLVFEGCPVSGFATFVLVGHQIFTMFLDTGSSTTVIPGASCTNCGNVPTQYLPADTGVATGYHLQSSYGIGSWDGVSYSDIVTVGGYPLFPSVRMKFGVTNSQSQFFSPTQCTPTVHLRPYGGLLGLGPQELAVPQTDAWLSVLFNGVPGLSKILAWQLCVGAFNQSGRFFIGNDGGGSARSGSFSNTPLLPISTNQFYKVAVLSIASGANTVSAGTVNYALDSGTTLTVLPSADFDALVSDITSRVAWNTGGINSNVFLGTSCYTAALSRASLDNILPKITLNFDGGQSIVLPATQSYLFPWGAAPVYCSGIVAGQGTSPLYIIGASFMAGLTISVNMETNIVGFAPANNCPTAGPVLPSTYYNFTGINAAMPASSLPTAPLLALLGAVTVALLFAPRV